MRYMSIFWFKRILPCCDLRTARHAGTEDALLRLCERERHDMSCVNAFWSLEALTVLTDVRGCLRDLFDGIEPIAVSARSSLGSQAGICLMIFANAVVSLGYLYGARGGLLCLSFLAHEDRQEVSS